MTDRDDEIEDLVAQRDYSDERYARAVKELTELDNLREEKANLEALVNANYDRAKELDQQYTELREAVRTWDAASRVWFAEVSLLPYDPELAAQRSIERQEAENRLRQLIEEKE